MAPVRVSVVRVALACAVGWGTAAAQDASPRASEPARGLWLAFDPAASSGPAGPQRPRGVELGARTEPLRGLQSAFTLWTLAVDDPVVQARQADAVEPVRPGRRRGIAWSHRYAVAPGWHLEAGLAWWHTHRAGTDETGRSLARAVDRAASIGVGVSEAGPWSAGMQWRRQRSSVAGAAFVTDLRVGRALGRHAGLALEVANVFDRPVDGLETIADREVKEAAARQVTVSLSLAF